MKNSVKYSVYIFLMLGLASCTWRAIPTANVNFIDEFEGVVHVRGTGEGANRMAAINNAEYNAFQVLLFRGLPGSQQKIPLIELTEQEARKRYPEYFKLFYKRLRYKTFVMSSVPVSDLLKSRCFIKTISVDMRINVRALRRDLEQNGMIRKFGL